MKEIKLSINGNEYSVKIEKFGSEEAKVNVNGTNYTVGLTDLGIEKAAQEGSIIPAASTAAPVARVSATPSAAVAAPAAVKKSSTPSAITDTSKAVLAPLPGLIMQIMVNEGDEVKAGQNVAIMEAMKMENHIPCNISGTIKEIRVKTGDSVAEGHALMILE